MEKPRLREVKRTAHHYTSVDRGDVSGALEGFKHLRDAFRVMQWENRAVLKGQQDRHLDAGEEI